jgi:1-acyl-sn-glycerol-3-phosphate acyltransferase
MDEMRNGSKGDMLVLFAEGTSGDGARVLPSSPPSLLRRTSRRFGSTLSIVYTGHRNPPMTRCLRPLYAWYGDMEMPHLWGAVAGPIEVKIICHAPLSLADHGNRKSLAKKAEEAVRQGLVDALHGRDKMR